MNQLDCDKYEDIFKIIDERVGDKYKNMLFVSEEEINDFRTKLRMELGSSIDGDVIDCYMFERHGLGGLGPYLITDDLEEVMVIGKDMPVFIYDRVRGMMKTELALSEGQIRGIIDRVSRYAGRVISGDTPLLDARLPDGSRVNATYPGVSPRGSTLTIRKFRTEPLNVSDLIRYETFDTKLSAFLWVVVEGLNVKPANILIVGGTASGKTTTLNVLSYFIPQNTRILSIEDTLELNLRHEHWVPLETKPADVGKKNEVTMDDLVKNALRMRPDRIVIGEVRAEEALTVFTSMNTGHEGVMATLHANSARDALTRLRSHPMNVPDIMMPALDLIIAQKRMVEKGKLVRRVFEVAEVSGRESDNILTNTLFKYDAKTGRLELKLLNGRIIQNMSELANLSVREIDEEMNRREAILEGLSKKHLGNDDIHEIIQLYYKDPDDAVECTYAKIKETGADLGASSRGVLDI